MRGLADAIRTGNARRAAEFVEVEGIGESLLRGAGAAPGEASAVDRLLEALQGGGTAAQRQLPAREARLIGALDITNPEALRYIQESVPDLIRYINQDAATSIQQAVRRGFSEGRTPPKVARDIRQSIGLTPSQEDAVANFRTQLESGDVGNATPPWQRRLSATEAQQARSIFRRPVVPAAEIDRLVGKYAERLLNLRASTISRTEIHRAHISGQEELWRQGTEAGYLDEDRARRFWIVTADERLRDDHRRIPGMNPNGVGLGEPFRTPIGPVMGPGQSGKPAFDVGCRCTIALRFVDA